LLGEILKAWGVSRCQWWLDRPVSNTARLKQRMLDLAAANDWDWQVELVFNPDKVLAECDEIIATSDSVILDRCQRWVNLPDPVIQERIPQARLVGFTSDHPV
jgi:hypothetical protein